MYEKDNFFKKCWILNSQNIFLWLTEMKNLENFLILLFKIIILTLHMKELICPHPPSNCLDDNDVIAVTTTKDFSSI